MKKNSQNNLRRCKKLSATTMIDLNFYSFYFKNCGSRPSQNYSFFVCNEDNQNYLFCFVHVLNENNKKYLLDNKILSIRVYIRCHKHHSICYSFYKSHCTVQYNLDQSNHRHILNKNTSQTYWLTIPRTNLKTLGNIINNNNLFSLKNVTVRSTLTFSAV